MDPMSTTLVRVSGSTITTRCGTRVSAGRVLSDTAPTRREESTQPSISQRPETGERPEKA